jgi:sterol desaturase/sphingolipid hydroxylase (fatty acid hydroxylase superfamily)
VHFGPLRHVLVDNRFHRIHHSLEERHFDKNFGITFSLWDQLFRTAHFPSANEWPDVGIAGHAPPATLRDFLCYPLGFLPRRTKLEHNLKTAAPVGEPSRVP